MIFYSSTGAQSAFFMWHTNMETMENWALGHGGGGGGGRGQEFSCLLWNAHKCYFPSLPEDSLINELEKNRVLSNIIVLFVLQELLWHFLGYWAEKKITWDNVLFQTRLQNRILVLLKGSLQNFRSLPPGYAPYVNKVTLTWTISWVQKVKLHDLHYTSYKYATMYLHVILIIKHERLCLTTVSKHWEESWK